MKTINKAQIIKNILLCTITVFFILSLCSCGEKEVTAMDQLLGQDLSETDVLKQILKDNAELLTVRKLLSNTKNQQGEY